MKPHKHEKFIKLMADGVRIERKVPSGWVEADLCCFDWTDAEFRIAPNEKEASAIINAVTADIHITVPLRDYTDMSPKDCYELGMMDGVAALKTQINAAIAQIEEGK